MEIHRRLKWRWNWAKNIEGNSFVHVNKERVWNEKWISIQYAIWPSVTDAVCDPVENLHCKLPQKAAPTHFLEPERISGAHEEGGLIVGLMCL